MQHLATLQQRYSNVAATPPDNRVQNTDNIQTHGVCDDSSKPKKTRKKSKPAAWTPADWVDLEGWQRWEKVVGAQDWHPEQLNQALASLDHAVNACGWPQLDVIERSISRGYKSFFPLNAKGQPEKNPERQRPVTQISCHRTALEQDIFNARQEFAHWQRMSAEGDSQSIHLLSSAREKLAQLEAKQSA